jgi:hypothetical protein
VVIVRSRRLLKRGSRPLKLFVRGHFGDLPCNGSLSQL